MWEEDMLHLVQSKKPKMHIKWESREGMIDIVQALA